MGIITPTDHRHFPCYMPVLYLPHPLMEFVISSKMNKFYLFLYYVFMVYYQHFNFLIYRVLFKCE